MRPHRARPLQRVLAILGLCGILLGACQDRPTPRDVLEQGEVHLRERIVVPVGSEEEAGGFITSLALGNSGYATGRCVVSDAGISAELLGFSNCVGGCVGLRSP